MALGGNQLVLTPVHQANDKQIYQRRRDVCVPQSAAFNQGRSTTIHGRDMQSVMGKGEVRTYLPTLDMDSASHPTTSTVVIILELMTRVEVEKPCFTLVLPCILIVHYDNKIWSVPLLAPVCHITAYVNGRTS